MYEHVNNTAKPLVFVGSNNGLHRLKDTCEQIGFTVAGIIDDDFAHSIQDIPIIGRLQDINSMSGYQFFCATNWQPDNQLDQYVSRNRLKRQTLIELLEQSGCDIASILSLKAEVCLYKTKIGRGCFIDSFAQIWQDVHIGDWTNVYSNSLIAVGGRVGRNCVIQRYCAVIDSVSIQDNSYIGVGARILRDGATIGAGTFLHPNISIFRDTKPNEIVSLAGLDLRKVYSNQTMAK